MSDTLSMLPDYRRPSPEMLRRIAEVDAGGERWRPHRLLVVNWWLWDEQEFYFGRGWQLFRGPNMAGKSLLLTTLVPLIFDGDKRRHRLDTFGGDGRNADYYVLGAPEATPDSEFYHEERIGYAALELRHPATGEHRTIGIALHGRRVGGAQMESVFWGFVLRDGRRLGHELSLVSSRTRAPLTRGELAEALGANPVVDRPADYQAAVNDALFGFRTVEDFRHAMDITLSLRRPGLSKDLKPEDMCRLLSESLPEIDPEVLEQMAGTLEAIDGTKKSIEDTARHLAAVRKMDDALGAYLNQLAQRRALHFLRADDGRTAAGEALAAARDTLAREEAAILAASSRLARLDAEEAAARGRKLELEKSEAFATRERLQELAEEVRGAGDQVRRGERGVAEREEAIRKGMDREARLRREWADEARRQRERADELRAEAEAARWREAADHAARLEATLEALAGGPGAADPGPVSSGVLEALGEARVEALGTAEAACRAVDQARAGMEKAQARLEHAQAERSFAEDARARAQDALAAARTDAAGALLGWADGAVEVRVGREARTAMVDAAHAYADHAADPAALVAPAEREAERRQRGLEDQRADAELRRREAEARRLRLEDELAGWESRAWAAPEPRPGQTAVRAALEGAGVSFAPLYACVDVRPGTPPEVALAVEAALEGAGLLDAAVIAERDRDRAPALIAAAARETLGGDCWLDVKAPPVPGPSLLDVLVPVECGLPAGEVEAVLRSVGLDAPGRTVSMAGADGTWRLGVLGGAAGSGGETAPRFVGETNRLRVREEKIRALRSELAALADALRTLDGEVAALSGRIEALRGEVRALRALPELARLRDTAASLAAATAQVSRLTGRVREATEEVEGYRGELLQRRSALLEALRDLPELPRDLTASGFRSLAGHARAVLRMARTASQDLLRFGRLREHVHEAAGDVARARAALDEAREALAHALLELKGKESQYEALRERLDAMGLGDLVSEIQRLAETIRRCESERLVGERAKAGAEARRDGARTAEAAAAEATGTASRVLDEATRQLSGAVGVYPAAALVAARRILDDPAQGARAAAEHLLRLRRTTPERWEQEIDEGVERHQRELGSAFADTRSILAEYGPESAGDGMVTYRFHGSRIPPHALLAEIERQREAQELALRRDEDKLYEEFFLNELAAEIQKRIEEARELKEGINRLLAGKRFGRGAVAFHVQWKAREDAGGEYGTLVELLQRDVDLLPPDKVAWIKDFFRKHVARVRAEEAEGTLEQTYAAALREVFDYRKWFEFRVFSQEHGERPHELRGARFRRGSGAQKALGIFCPLAAAAFVRFAGAKRPDAPRMIGLDEAFAGVDPANMDEMIRFLVELDFSVVMTSEKLWGTSPSLPACATYDLQATAKVAAARLWLWDGAARQPDLPAPGSLLSMPIEVARVHSG